MVMRVAELLDAADERGEPFNTVHKALCLQEFQGTVNGGRRGGAAAFAQPVEQFVGAGGGGGVEHQAEHLAAQAGQARAALSAQRLGAVEQPRGAGRKCVGHLICFARGMHGTR